MKLKKFLRKNEGVNLKKDHTSRYFAEMAKVLSGGQARLGKAGLELAFRGRQTRIQARLPCTHNETGQVGSPRRPQFSHL